jgi:hypothetical protein
MAAGPGGDVYVTGVIWIDDEEPKYAAWLAKYPP